MDYDYKKGKERVEQILDNDIEINDKGNIPNDDNFTFNNGYYAWVTAIFVDIRDSSKLFSKKGLNDKEKTAKLVRAFTSEIIEILRDAEYLKEIGIRGDCVYAIYNTPNEIDEYRCARKTFYINTYLEMLNKLLEERGEACFKAGIGMATAQELVVKSGRKHTGINNKVWIGEAVTRASNLSSLGQKDGKKRLFFSSSSYNIFIKKLKKKKPEAENWFTEYTDEDGEIIYGADIIISAFNEWIKSGME